MSRRAGTKVLLVVAVAVVDVVVVVVVGVAAVVLRVVDVEIRPVDHLSLVAVVGSARTDSDDILESFASALVVLMNVRKSHAEFPPGNEQQVCTDKICTGRVHTGRIRVDRLTIPRANNDA